jgi:hypothetical protein
MFNKILFLLAAAVVMAGCSSTPPPVVRKPGSYTAITFPVVSDLWVDGNVQLATKNKNGCGEFSKNILPATPDKDFTLDIEGNRDIFFHISRADAQVECNKIATFYVTKGSVYTLNLETKNRQCEISLIEKTPGGAQNKTKTYPAHASMVDGIKVCENKDRLY